MTKTKLSTYIDKVISKFQKLGIEGWMKGATAYNKADIDVSPKSHEACKFCNEGVVKNIGGSPLYCKLDREWRTEFGQGMISLNDAQGTTFGANLERWFRLRSKLRAEGK